jgi:hypothetical protein
MQRGKRSKNSGLRTIRTLAICRSDLRNHDCKESLRIEHCGRSTGDGRSAIAGIDSDPPSPARPGGGS